VDGFADDRAALSVRSEHFMLGLILSLLLRNLDKTACYSYSERAERSARPLSHTCHGVVTTAPRF
jgi:hypothetical protein